MKPSISSLAVLASVLQLGCAADDVEIAQDDHGIIGGSAVTDRATLEYQNLVSITTTDADDSLRCSGSLISRRHVLTAAHCASGRAAATLRVNFGTAIPPQEERLTGNVAAAWVHPSYAEFPSDEITDWFGAHDIALLELAAPIPADKRVLPPFPLKQYAPLLGARVTIAGFGMTENLREIFAGEGTLDVLHATRVFLDEFLIPEDRGAKIVSHADAGRGVCFGDSGGPMIARPNRRAPRQAFVIGVTSESFDADYEYSMPVSEFECAGEDSYAGFTEVAAYVSWLSTTARHNFYDDALEMMKRSGHAFSGGDIRRVKHLAKAMEDRLDD